jgi:hypothetical protein
MGTAPVINLLTPDQSTCDPGTIFDSGIIAAGPLSLGGGDWAGRSFANQTPSEAFYFGGQGAPVIPGVPVTASAYLVGAGAQIRIAWEDSAGSFISSTTGPAQGVAGSAKRVWHTATPPVAAAAATVVADGASQAARPALTWTSELLEWGPGEGCPKAIVDELGRTARSASSTVDGWRGSDITFRIREVG